VTLPGAVRVVLLDIEGTTTPIAFVHDRLFGYVRSHLPQYVASHWNDAPVREVIRQLNDERAPEGWNPIAGPDALLGVVRDLMDRDRKSPGSRRCRD
jgi:enolase-phosphatase E1